MSEARTHRVRSRLAQEYRRPGGVTVAEAVHRAEAAVDQKKDEYIASLDAALSELQACYGANAVAPAVGDRERLYQLASTIIDLSLCVRDTGVDKAAHALCRLCDLIAEHGVWCQPCVELHVQVLQLLRRSGARMTGLEIGRVLDGLRSVNQKYFGAQAAGRA